MVLVGYSNARTARIAPQTRNREALAPKTIVFSPIDGRCVPRIRIARLPEFNNIAPRPRRFHRSGHENTITLSSRKRPRNPQIPDQNDTVYTPRPRGPTTRPCIQQPTFLNAERRSVPLISASTFLYFNTNDPLRKCGNLVGRTGNMPFWPCIRFIPGDHKGSVGIWRTGPS